MPLSIALASGTVLDQILHDTYPVWGQGLTFSAYTKFNAGQRRTPWGETHLDRVVLMDGSRSLASALRYDLTARFGGRIRRILGVGSVFTPRELRSRGAASALLAYLVDAANTEGFEYVLLFSEVGSALFERLDFVPLPLDLSEIQVHVQAGRGAPATLVRAGDDRDIPHVAEIGARSTFPSRFALDRSEDYIRFAIARRRLLAGLGPEGLRQTEFLVAEEGHMAVAYVVCTAHRGTWTIEEAGDRDPAGARLGAMLQVMLAREPSLAPPTISAWWPQSLRPPQLEVVSTKPTAEVMMIRPLRDRSLPMPPLSASDILMWHGDAY